MAFDGELTLVILVDGFEFMKLWIPLTGGFILSFNGSSTSNACVEGYISEGFPGRKLEESLRRGGSSIAFNFSGATCPRVS